LNLNLKANATPDWMKNIKKGGGVEKKR